MALEIHTTSSSFEGFVVIDSLVYQTSSGGLRISSDLKIDEIRDLSREMSLKYAWCRLPRGGAKSGLCLPADLTATQRTEALLAFGRDLAPLIQAGLYYPGMDLGCSAGDLITVYRGAGIALGSPTDTSLFTAFTVASAIEAWAAWAPGHGPRTLSIEGFGNVAGHLINLLPPDRFRVVALATALGGVARESGFTPRELLDARTEHRDALVHHLDGGALPREHVSRVNADVFLPAARTRTIDMALADMLSVQAVIPIANAPYAEGVPSRLHDRGIVSFPGFVTNCGGVFASSLYDSGVSRGDIEHIFSRVYRDTMTRLLDISKRLHRSPVDTASEVAGRILATRQTGSLTRSPWEKVRARTKRWEPRLLRQRSNERRCLESLRQLDADLAALGQQ